MAQRVHRPRPPARKACRRRSRPHDMFEPTDYDFPDDHEIEDWMLGQVDNGET